MAKGQMFSEGRDTYEGLHGFNQRCDALLRILSHELVVCESMHESETAQSQQFNFFMIRVVALLVRLVSAGVFLSFSFFSFPFFFWSTDGDWRRTEPWNQKRRRQAELTPKSQRSGSEGVPKHGLLTRKTPVFRVPVMSSTTTGPLLDGETALVEWLMVCLASFRLPSQVSMQENPAKILSENPGSGASPMAQHASFTTIEELFTRTPGYYLPSSMQKLSVLIASPVACWTDSTATHVPHPEPLHRTASRIIDIIECSQEPDAKAMGLRKWGFRAIEET